MLTEIRGHYDGKQIIVNENDRKNFSVGDEVIITVLNKVNSRKAETRAEKRKRLVNSGEFVIPTGRTVEEIYQSMERMRDDRF